SVKLCLCSAVTVFTILFSLLYRKLMSAPSVLRVGTPANIFVECQDCTDDTDIRVDIIVMSYPTKSKRLASESVILTSAKHFQGFGQIRIPAGDFSNDPNMKQFVYLQARFPDAELEQLVLVSFQSAYIYIQTDKTLYTPSSTVHYRMFAVTPGMEPVERANETDTAIAIEIMVLLQVISTACVCVCVCVCVCSIGLWKVVAKFHSKPQQSFSAEFEVKEYVLPSFEVKLTNDDPFFYVDDKKLDISIRAMYLFGEEVEGTAYGVFGVMHGGQKKSLPSSLQRVQINRGEGVVTLTKEHIMHSFPNIHDLLGSSIFVAVGVLTESGSEMVEAELRGIKIVQSPYTIHFKRTSKYFKPGMSFDVAIEVVNPDGSPAQGVAVLVDPGDVQGVTAENGMARLSINTENNPTPMTAKTNDPRISPERQASANMTAIPYSTKSNSYIHIAVDSAEVILGENLKINLNLNKQENTENDITYLILSRGQLVKYGRYKAKGQVLISVMDTVTKNMLPSFRIIAYYHTNDYEVVSDSVWVDAKDSCMGSLKLESARSSSSYEPRKMFGLKVTGDPGATVGLVAVDKGVYVLNNKHHLNQKKVWDMVETYDTGCTPGGGKDGISVFSDAGLLFQSNMASGTTYRQELNCPAPSRSRKKRSTPLRDVTGSLASQYEDQMQRDCCLDGIRDVPVSYTCEMRSEYIGDGEACVEAFLHCCKEMESQRAERKEDSLQLARSEEDDSYMDTSEIVSRTKFPESWLWTEIKLDTTSMQKDFPLQDSITTWQFIGISLSRTHGICVAEPLEVIVKKDFFIDLRMPYSAVRGEQIEVKTVLHNISPDPAMVLVELTETAHVCSAASKRGKYVQQVKVGRQSTRTVPFVIIPTKEGEYHIEVKAAVQDSFLSDGVMKTLRVVVRATHSMLWIQNGKHVEIINSRIPVQDFVPNTPTSTQISVTGKEHENIVRNGINGKSMDQLITQPSGCGEENMIRMTLPLIAITYLDQTNQWEPEVIEKRAEGLEHIKTGYKNELNYQKNDGSFAGYTDQQSSTWLTAYVAKVFAMANNLVAVERNVVCDAVKFLILRALHPNGMFNEAGKVYHREMMGDVNGTDSDASMTAFCLIAMQESRTLCAATVSSLSGSIDKAAAYLEKRLPSLINPYAVAMTSYALANENKLNQEILFKFASRDLSHWQVPKGRVYTLEATAYALLALVKAQVSMSQSPVSDCQQPQKHSATIMVYQAVAEFWTSPKGPEYDLNVDILLPGRSKPTKYNFNRDNLYATRTSKVRTHTHTHTHTHTMDKKRDAAMSLLDVGLLTGFTANTNDLSLLSKGRARTISKYTMVTADSERGSVIIYLDKVSHTRPEEITFRIHQKLNVGVLQPAAVSVYEHNDVLQSSRYVFLIRRAGQLLRLCRGDVCICAEENCSMQKKGNISNADRTAKVCETELNSRIDFGKCLCQNVKMAATKELHEMEKPHILFLKYTGNDVGPLGKLRTFLSNPHCREALDLRKGKTYLIMGDSERRTDEQSQYVLGERTWVEYWPTEAECKSQKHKLTCSGMLEMVQKYTQHGCEQ
uniref:Complement C3-like n=1 Tax=Sparus aurata TaxID=8175 RepID=A0A671XRD4_SPAAU